MAAGVQPDNNTHISKQTTIMSNEITDMPGIEAAMERFGAIEESSAANAAGAAATPATRETRTPDAPATVRADAPDPDSQPTDTRAAAVSKPAASENPNETTSTDKVQKAEPDADADTDAAADAKTRMADPARTAKPAQPATPGQGAKPDAVQPTEPAKSRYAKSQERLTRTWEQVNAEKASLAADKTRLESERAELTRQRAELDAIREQAQGPQFTPDDYVKASQTKRQAADATRLQAGRAEKAGKFEDAARLNRQADKLEGQAEDMADYAEQLRKHPPASFEQRARQHEEARKFYTIEAAKAYPDLVRNGSDFQRHVAAELQALSRQDPQLAAQPGVIYHAARLVHLSLRAKALEADAARVPVLVKEAESLRAKIKELEALTTPAGGGSVSRLDAEAPADDYQALRQAAAESGALFR
jgi:hypothetical protein